MTGVGISFLLRGDARRVLEKWGFWERKLKHKISFNPPCQREKQKYYSSTGKHFYIMPNEVEYLNSDILCHRIRKI